MTPPTPNPPSPKRLPGDRRRLRVIALVAVAGLALSSAFVAFTGHAAAQPADATRQAWSTRANALTQLDAAATLPDAGAAIRQVNAATNAALDPAKGALAAAVATAHSSVADILGSGALAQLPADYVQGMDLKGHVQVAKVAPFPLPSLGGDVSIGSFQSANVRLDAATIASRGLHAPPVGVAPVDAAVQQLMAAYDGLEGTLGSVGSVVPGGLPVAVPVGVPSLGSMPSQAQGANDAADPDEKGAQTAGTHATAVLATAESAAAVGGPALASLLAQYQGLAGKVQALVDDIHAKATDARDTIQQELQDRLDALQQELASAQKQALATASAQRKAIEDAVGAARTSIEDAVAQQVEAAQAATEAGSGRLTELANRMPAMAEAARGRIQETIDSATANLSALRGVDTHSSVQALQAAGARALQKVTQDSLANVAALQAAAADVQAKGEAAVRQVQQHGAAELDALAAKAAQALAKADDLKAYLMDTAAAQQVAAQAAVQDAAKVALGKLGPLEESQVAKVTQAGLQAVAAAGPLLDQVDALVAKVDDAAGPNVQKDIEYVVKVSSDYAKVPTGPRMERANAWDALANLASGRLDKVLGAMDTMSGLADQLQQAAQRAQAQITAMT